MTKKKKKKKGLKRGRPKQLAGESVTYSYKASIYLKSHIEAARNHLKTLGYDLTLSALQRLIIESLVTSKKDLVNLVKRELGDR